VRREEQNIKVERSDPDNCLQLEWGGRWSDLFNMKPQGLFISSSGRHAGCLFGLEFEDVSLGMWNQSIRKLKGQLR
jgi:hypothetical protein